MDQSEKSRIEALWSDQRVVKTGIGLEADLRTCWQERDGIRIEEGENNGNKVEIPTCWGLTRKTYS